MSIEYKPPSTFFKLLSQWILVLTPTLVEPLVWIEGCVEIVFVYVADQLVEVVHNGDLSLCFFLGDAGGDE